MRWSIVFTTAPFLECLRSRSKFAVWFGLFGLEFLACFCRCDEISQGFDEAPKAVEAERA